MMIQKEKEKVKVDRRETKNEKLRAHNNSDDGNVER